MKMIHTLLRAALGLVFLALPSAAQFGFGGNAFSTLYTKAEDDVLLAALEIEIDLGWYLYHWDKGPGTGAPTVITWGGDGLEWNEPRWPEPHKHDIPAIGKEPASYTWVHTGTIVLYATAQMESPEAAANAFVTIQGQTCEDGPFGTCVPYNEDELESDGEGEEAVWAAFPRELIPGSPEALAAAERGEDPTASELPTVEEEETSLAAFLGLAVFWALFTLLMPCTYPMIPITISFFTKQADARGGKVLPLSLLYGAGIVLIFILIGVVVGAAIIPFATHPITNLVIAAFFVLFAFALFGMINLEPPAAMMNLAGKASMTGGYLGVFLMGATLVITSFTCTAPFVGSLLSVGAGDGDLGRIVMGMGTFGLTMAIPFVLLSLVPGKIAAMPRSGQWMNTLKVTLGFIELAAAFKFISNADLVWEWFVFSRELFLLLWAVIFFAAAAYLLFFAEGKRAQLTGGRSIAGWALALLAAWCLYGMTGKELDRVMTAIVPNYSGGRIMPVWWASGAKHQIVIDDYDRAVEVAREQNKLLLVNFTGHT